MDVSGNCENLALILKGKGKQEDGVCTVAIDRKDIHATIGNRPFHSLSHMFHFEPADPNGNALITGEIVLLENEVPEITVKVSNAGIIVAAIHSHWLFDKPKLMYIHIETAMEPVAFAMKMTEILPH